MYVIVNGRKKRFVGAYHGERRIAEIYLGAKKIWPITEGVAKRIRVEIPKQGTRDWQYWVHAMQAVSGRAMKDNYMRIMHDEIPYYLVNSPDGSIPYEFDGNYLTLNYGEGIPIDAIGSHLEVEANIKAREGEHTYFKTYAGWDYFEWDMPFIPGSKIGGQVIGAGKRASYVYFRNLTTKPSGFKWTDLGDGHRNDWYPRVPKSTVTENQIPENDTSVSIEAQLSGSTHPAEEFLYPVWPAFKRLFKLKVISVE